MSTAATPAPVGWFEIAGTDTAKTEAFYGQLFNWTFGDGPVGPAYRMADTGEGLPGAVTTAQAGMPTNYAMFSVMVPDVAAACEQVAALGGKVLAGPETLPDGLTFANFADPDGSVVGVFAPPSA